MRTLIPIILLSIILSSCVSSKHTLYGRCGNHYFGCSQILLSDNKRFEYFQFYDVGGVKRIVSGNWQKNNDTLILNTDEQEADRLVRVVEDRIDTLSKNLVEFDEWFHGAVEINGIKTILEGTRVYFQKNTDAIKFIFYENDGRPSPVFYKVKNSNANYFRVTTKTLDTWKVFKNEKFIVNKKKMYSLESEPWILQRTNLKHKQW